MFERRKYKRSRSPQLMPVIDLYTDKSIGMLVDLSLGGMLMMAIQPIPSHRIFQLQVKLPEPIKGSHAIEFGAESVWGDPPEQLGTCWAGFQVIDISEENKEIVAELVEIWSDQDADIKEISEAV
ncbi:MAG TPA: PilZ domain-containing protein [Crenotrichaceae bacterium]|nr:PilZ domain-containing protein [Crenotrichaceae bacterium]